MLDVAVPARAISGPPYDDAGTTIAIIGAGFSGTLLAIQLLRRCPASTHIILIERRAQHGSGLAYATRHLGHLLNVPAAKMSAFPDQPLDFLQWLQQQPVAETGIEAPGPATFAPRAVYGTYIRALLHREHAAQHHRLALVSGDVIGVEQGTGALRLHLSHGPSLSADLVVLATGNLPPCPIPVSDGSFYDTGYYRHDPWAPGTLDDLDPDAAVLLIGTGLTMIDMVIALLDQGHRGLIHAVSRRGLLPHRHKTFAPAPGTAAAYPTRLTALARFLRAEALAAEAAGSDWRAIVDGLRPITADVWQALSIADQRRFLRHLRPWWDIHRHRIAGPVADRVEAARSDGQLWLHAGRLQHFAVETNLAAATIRRRGDGVLMRLTVSRVINCTGPGIECDRLTDPLLRALFRSGLVRADPLGLALDVAPTGALRSADGSLAQCLFAVGPPTRAALWEMTAVPDIRGQCEALAQQLSTLVAIAPPSTPRPPGRQTR